MLDGWDRYSFHKSMSEIIRNKGTMAIQEMLLSERN